MKQPPNSNRTPIPASRSHIGMSIWDVSIEFANKIYTLAYVALVVGAILTAAATMSLFWASAVRDRYSDGQIAMAQEASAKANERASILESQTADIQRQTAEANLKAEQERLARIKIEERLAGRSISVIDAVSFVDAIKRFSGTPVDIFITGDGFAEIANLAGRIHDILIVAKWVPIDWTWTGVSPVRGVMVFTKPGTELAIIDAANALASNLTSRGIASASTPWRGDWTTFAGMLNGPTFDSNRSSIRVVIGSKPD